MPKASKQQVGEGGAATCHVYEITEKMRLQSLDPNVEPTIALLEKAHWRWTDVPK